MSLTSIPLNVVGRRGCEDFAKGDCKRGQACNLEHHYNLDPARREDNGRQDYNVPNDLGIACLRCIQQLRQCDKNGRSGDDDPCSECRHFGGPDCNCRLTESLSYNDQAWGQMILRNEDGFNLAQPKNRDDPIRGHKNRKTKTRSADKVPGPIDDAYVKSNWRGETREQLLQKPDYLPTFVRQLPRAHLVPPRIKDKNGKRDASSLTLSGSAATPTTAPGVASQPTLALPLPRPDMSEVVRYEYDVTQSRTTYGYKSGVKVVVPGAITQRGHAAGPPPILASALSSSGQPSKRARTNTSPPDGPSVPSNTGRSKKPPPLIQASAVLHQPGTNSGFANQSINLGLAKLKNDLPSVPQPSVIPDRPELNIDDDTIQLDFDDANADEGVKREAYVSSEDEDEDEDIDTEKP